MKPAPMTELSEIIGSDMKEELLALAERCEQATGPSDALDGDIHEAMTGKEPFKGGRWSNTPRYSSSLDAAMTLVPEGCSWNLHKHSMWARAGVFVDDGSDPGHYCDAPTPALALCAAALRARASEEKGS